MSASPDPGSLVGDHEIIAPLRACRTGSLHRARRLDSGREVALRIFRVSGPEAIHIAPLLLREWSRLAGLSHPHLVDFIDQGMDGHWVFLSMPLSSGESLRQRLDRQDLPDLVEGCTWMLGVARGLSALHARGLLHRDLSPDGILLDDAGGVRIADLGLPWSRETLRAATAGDDHGEGSFVAPELLESTGYGEPSDIFALGEVFRRTLGGVPRSGDPGRERVDDLIQSMRAARPGSRPPATRVVLGMEEFLAAVRGGGTGPDADVTEVNSGDLARERLGPYSLLGVLGMGGSGVVYRARHHELGREVALKVLGAEQRTEPAQFRDFRHEMVLSSRLAHRNLVRVLDCDLETDPPYLAMELVEGGSLRERLDRGGRLPWREAMSIGHHLLEGLVYLHGEGILHRDIKPSNVLLTRDCIAKLTDFGIARCIGEKLDSRSGSFVGTLQYAAPERFMGEGHTERADLWSLGVTLYELLTGRLPIPLEDYLSWALEGGRPLDPPGRVDPTIPAPVGRLVMRLLERHAPERPASARVVKEALEGLLGTLSGTSVPPSDVPEVTEVLGPRTEILAEPARPPGTPPRHPWVRIAGFALLVLVLGLMYRFLRSP